MFCPGSVFRGRAAQSSGSSFCSKTRSNPCRSEVHVRKPSRKIRQGHRVPRGEICNDQGKIYAEVGAPPEGDAVTALERFSATIRDSSAPLADKQLVLRFIAHIFGDLQQPLHAGNGMDMGGNEIRVTFNGKPTNLHAVWDTALADDEQLSYSEMAGWLGDRIIPADAKTWSSTDLRIWTAESAELRDRIYPANGDTNLSCRYIFDHTAQMELRLE